MIRHRPLFLIRAILSKDAKGAMNDGAREQRLHINADRIAAQHTGKRIEMIEGAGKAWVRSAIFWLIASIANQETIFS
jgi:hypothetical protein